ncbi:MAG: DNA methyltransferase [Dehalococcoidia bacterium]
MSEQGSFFLHLGVNIASYLRPVLDELFGPTSYTNEIVWKRSAAHSDIGQGASHLGRLHDVIFWYRNSVTSTVRMVYEPYSDDYVRSFYKHVDPDSGRRYALDNTSGPGGARKGNPYYEFKGVTKYWRYSQSKVVALYDEGRLIRSKDGSDWRYKRYLDEMPGVPIQDLWLDIPPLQSQSPERTGYDTQKPERLLERVINLASNPGDLVLDCFCGSGTTPVVAEKLGRRWIAADLGRFAIHVTRKRLLGIPEVKPFDVQNLGKYERQAWQSAEFGAPKDETLQTYRRFILDLYHGEQTGSQRYLHGLKAGRWVHVGEVDSPIALGDLRAISIELRATGNNRVDVLGWDFAFNTNEEGKDLMRQAGVDVRFLKIPREVLEKRAVEQGDIVFFELGALGVATEVDGRSLTVTLTDFVIPLDDLPADVRAHVSHWSQTLDYWAVDWDYRGDAFHNQWQSYRTRKDPKLALSARHTYDEPGDYRLMVKAIDILGNDTTKIVEVHVPTSGGK